MTAILFRRAALAVAAILLLGSARSSAQVLLDLGPSYSGNNNVQAYFASQGDAFHEGDPIALAWGTGVTGPYGGFAVPNVPSPPGSALYNSLLPTSNSFYSGPYTSNFTDSGSPATTAVATTSSGPVGGTSVASAYVQTVLGLNEPLASPNYAYEQVDFAEDFGAAGVLTGGIGGAPSFLVNATTTGALSYAQFSGVMNYYWHESSTAFTLSTGYLWSYLGSVDYDWTQNGPGTYTMTVTPIGGSLLATPNSPGVLEVSGDFFVAGDPADFSVEVVPEPSSWLLLGIGLAALVAWSVRRRAIAV